MCVCGGGGQAVFVLLGLRTLGSRAGTKGAEAEMVKRWQGQFSEGGLVGTSPGPRAIFPVFNFRTCLGRNSPAVIRILRRTL